MRFEVATCLSFHHRKSRCARPNKPDQAPGSRALVSEHSRLTFHDKEKPGRAPKQILADGVTPPYSFRANRKSTTYQDSQLRAPHMTQLAPTASRIASEKRSGCVTSVVPACWVAHGETTGDRFPHDADHRLPAQQHSSCSKRGARL